MSAQGRGICRQTAIHPFVSLRTCSSTASTHLQFYYVWHENGEWPELGSLEVVKLSFRRSEVDLETNLLPAPMLASNVSRRQVDKPRKHWTISISASEYYSLCVHMRDGLFLIVSFVVRLFGLASSSAHARALVDDAMENLWENGSQM